MLKCNFFLPKSKVLNWVLQQTFFVSVYLCSDTWANYAHFVKMREKRTHVYAKHKSSANVDYLMILETLTFNLCTCNFSF